MQRFTTFCLVTACSLALIAPSGAFAQDPADVADIRERVCLRSALAKAPDAKAAQFDYEGKKWQRVSNERVAFYMISELGVVASPGEALAIVDAVARDENNAEFDIATTLEELSSDLLNYEAAFKLRAFDQNGAAFNLSNARESRSEDIGWFLAPPVTLACEIGEEKADTGRPVLANVRLRGEVSDLTVDGEKRKTASAATLGFNRIREFKDDGSRTETETANFKGALGLVLAPSAKRELPNLLAFVAYEQQTSKARDLLPVATQPAAGDDETKLLQFGLVGSDIVKLNGYDTSISLTMETAYLIDFTDDSERVRLNLKSSLYHFDGIKGLTGIGRYRNELGNNLWTRLDIEAIANFNVLTNRGQLTMLDGTTFGHLGGRVAFSAAVGKTYSNGPFFTAEYLRLARIDGDREFIPQIKRHQLTLGNRWWFGDDLAVEVSAKLIDGENVDSFADENELSVNFGLIF
jgi:hypothetical protein